MSMEITSYEDESLLDWASWAQSNGLWDGRHVSLEDAQLFQNEVVSRIQSLLLLNGPNSTFFDQMGSILSWVGTNPEDRALLASDIQSLTMNPYGKIILTGGLSDFWHKYQIPILIGIGIVAVITVVVVVAICSGGTAATAAGAAALCSIKKKEDDDLEFDTPLLADNSGMLPLNIEEQEYSNIGNLTKSEFEFLVNDLKENGLKHIDGYVDWSSINNSDVKLSDGPAYKITQPPPRLFPFFGGGYLETEKTQTFYLKNYAMEPTRPTLKDSPFSNCRIGGINGMCTKFHEAVDHAQYLSNFIPTKSIEWVYNRTNNPVNDGLEILGANYSRISPNTAKELQNNWTSFHEEMKDSPDSKYLQFCHSQGAIHVRNALLASPKEIRDRVIVIAIAPGAIVPKNLCYMSYNYASSKDIVPKGEVAFAGFINPGDSEASEFLMQAYKNHEELIILKPLDNSWCNGEHGFQDLIFKNEISDQIEKYFSNNGVYK